MRFLLDTHTLVWAAISSSRLSATAAALMADQRNELLVSAATAWEISTKVRLGKFPEAEPLERDLAELAHAAGYTLLPIQFKTALRSGRLIGQHGDPFDRMLAAQALELDLQIISNDAKLDEFLVRRIW